MRSPNPDHICGLCDEFDVDQAGPELAAQGMGRCLVRDERGPLHLHVAWDGWTCVSFRLDVPSLRRRQQFALAQRRARLDAAPGE
jgi:hypothetical protein